MSILVVNLSQSDLRFVGNPDKTLKETSVSNYAFYLLVLLGLCHWLGDFSHLTTKWMQEAKRYGHPFEPILAHACAHGGLMCLALQLSSASQTRILWTCLFQVLMHFCIDMTKGALNGLYPSLENQREKPYWYIFGFDQFLHFFTILVMVKALT